MLISPPRPMKITGTCQMCERPNLPLQMISFWDYEGYTCSQCTEKLKKENLAKMIFAMEHAEPAE